MCVKSLSFYLHRFVCKCIYVCIYAYIFIFIYTDVYVYVIYVYIYIIFLTCICIFLSAYMYICIGVCRYSRQVQIPNGWQQVVSVSSEIETTNALNRCEKKQCFTSFLLRTTQIFCSMYDLAVQEFLGVSATLSNCTG